MSYKSLGSITSYGVIISPFLAYFNLDNINITCSYIFKSNSTCNQNKFMLIDFGRQKSVSLCYLVYDFQFDVQQVALKRLLFLYYSLLLQIPIRNLLSLNIRYDLKREGLYLGFFLIYMRSEERRVGKECRYWWSM